MLILDFNPCDVAITFHVVPHTIILAMDTEDIVVDPLPLILHSSGIQHNVYSPYKEKSVSRGVGSDGY